MHGAKHAQWGAGTARWRPPGSAVSMRPHTSRTVILRLAATRARSAARLGSGSPPRCTPGELLVRGPYLACAPNMGTTLGTFHEHTASNAACQRAVFGLRTQSCIASGTTSPSMQHQCFAEQQAGPAGTGASSMLKLPQQCLLVFTATLPGSMHACC
jgi:hypothetical protein